MHSNASKIKIIRTKPSSSANMANATKGKVKHQWQRVCNKRTYPE